MAWMPYKSKPSQNKGDGKTKRQISEKAARILEVVKTYPGITQLEIVEHTGLKQNTVSYNLMVLAAYDMIETVPNGRYWRYRATKEAEKR